MNLLYRVAVALVLLGGVNWALVAFNMNLVESLFGGVMESVVTKVVYMLVGVSALWMLYEKRDRLMGTQAVRASRPAKSKKRRR